MKRIKLARACPQCHRRMVDCECSFDEIAMMLSQWDAAMPKPVVWTERDQDFAHSIRIRLN